MQYKRFPIGALWTNSYLFWNDDTKDAFFIDPGGKTTDVQKFLGANNLSLKTILLTHGHIDHVAGINELVPMVGDEIYIHSGDAEMLRHPSKELQDLLGVKFGGLESFREIEDGRVFDFAGYHIQTLATPGHTEGSVCYLITDSSGHKVLVSGDTLFAQSVGRTDLEGGDWYKLESSLRRIAQFEDGLHVLPGHVPDTTIGSERELNPYWPKED